MYRISLKNTRGYKALDLFFWFILTDKLCLNRWDGGAALIMRHWIIVIFHDICFAILLISRIPVHGRTEKAAGLVFISGNHLRIFWLYEIYLFFLSAVVFLDWEVQGGSWWTGAWFIMKADFPLVSGDVLLQSKQYRLEAVSRGHSIKKRPLLMIVLHLTRYTLFHYFCVCSTFFTLIYYTIHRIHSSNPYYSLG